MRISNHVYLWFDYYILVLLLSPLLVDGQKVDQILTAIQPYLPTTVNQAQLQTQTSPAKPSHPPLVPATDNISPLIKALAVPTVPIQAKNPIATPINPARPVIRELNLQNIQENNEEPLVQLDYSSFRDQILAKRTANFVYFNANFNHCRNCDKFLNIWRELAYDIQWWRQVIKLFVINCSDEDNLEVCRQAGVTQFPQVKFYWVMSSSLDSEGQRLRILGKSVHAMRHMITDKIVENYVEHNKLLANKKKQPQNLLDAFSSGNSIASSASLTALIPIMSRFSEYLGSNSRGVIGTSGSSGLTNFLETFTGKSGSLGSLAGISSLLQTLAPVKSGALQHRLNLQHLPSNWPELEPIVTTNSEKLLDMLPIDANKNFGAFLIMETPEFLYTGIEVMFDLNLLSNYTYIARVSDESSQLCKNLTSRADILAPALVYVSPTRELSLVMTAPRYTNDEDVRRVFVKAALEKRQTKRRTKTITKSLNPSSVVTAHNQEDEEILNRSNQVYRNDLINAVRASLMEQVYRHPDLSDDQYNTLVRYVYVLINYYPFRPSEDDGALKFFKRLHTWLQNQVSPIDVSEYKKQFHDINEVFPQQEWMACKSLSSIKAVPKSRKSSSLLENPAQIGKMVSNFTRIFRNYQHQSGNMKNLLNLFTGSKPPVMLNHIKQQKSSNSSTTAKPLESTITPSSSRKSNLSDQENSDKPDSPFERLFKSLTSGSLGSDSSILRLISSALAGGSGSDIAAGKSKFAREYPCGAWKLAHALVVNEYKKDSPRKEVKHIVLITLYQYLLHFYACSTCGNRVAEVSSEFRFILDDHLLDQGDSIMFLWKVHNRVNQRLAGESRPGSPNKDQFPKESLCPKCRFPRSQNDLVSTPNWNDKHLFQFIYHHYKLENIVFLSNSSDSSSAATHLRPKLVTSSIIHLYLTTVIILICCAALSNSASNHMLVT